MKRILLSGLLFLLALSSWAQVIKFQSAGAGGTTPSRASNGTITHFGVVGSPVSQGAGHHNQAGFFFANIDYRPSVQASAISITGYTTNSITLSWVNGNGARRIVVARAGNAVNATPSDGTAYTANAVFASGSQIGTGNYVIYDGTGNSVTITGLSPGTVYHFKAFEYNGKYGTNNVNIVYQPGNATGNPANHTTRAAEPTAQATELTFPEITATTMNASFIAATGSPAGYIVLRKTGSSPTEVPVDGTTYTVNTNFGTSRVVHVGSGTQFSNTALTAGTIYHYAVYAYNGSGLAINYLTGDPLRGEKITVPDIPPRPSHTDATSGGFRVNWTAMQGASGYEIQVSVTESFTSFISGYGPFAVSGGSTVQHLLTGLPTATYFYRVQAVNASGESGYSDHWNVYIQSAGGGGTPLSISTPTSLSGNIGVTVSGGADVDKDVKVYWRGIRGTNFATKPLTRQGETTTYQTTIDASVADQLGVEYYVEATDGITTVSTQNPSNDYIYKPIPSNTTLNLPFGGTVGDYRIISIPYSLSLNNTAIVFSALGAVDKTKWRLLNWNGSAYVDNPTTIAAGQGYWFNARAQHTITLGEGTVSQNNQSSPFALQLRQGWNMIATPYPFAVNWDDVLEYNNNPTVGDYYVFQGTGYTTGNALEPWEGGFVYADHAQLIKIPVVFTSSSGMRKGFREQFNSVPGNGNWLLPITLKQGDVENQLSAFGMHEEALESKDRFDAVALPRFIEYVDLTTTREESFIPYLMRDVVPLQQQYVWPFTLETSGSEPVTIQWNSEAIQNSKAQLLLYDAAAGKLTDMRTTATYTTPNGNNRQLQFIFNTGEHYAGNRELGKAYPNPFTKEINLPGYLHTTEGQASVTVSIISLTGVEVYNEKIVTSTTGLLQPVWDGTNSNGFNLPPGVYVYKVLFNSGKQSYVSMGKIVKQ